MRHTTPDLDGRSTREAAESAQTDLHGEATPTDSHTPGSRSGLGHAHHPRGWVARVSLTDVLVIRTVGMIPRSTILKLSTQTTQTIHKQPTPLRHSRLQIKQFTHVYTCPLWTNYQTTLTKPNKCTCQTDHHTATTNFHIRVATLH